ncbi:MAG: response regulator [Alphaproteobacteria bacterium]|nr:response regulator [Alphaproteobacteria bacterium]
MFSTTRKNTSQGAQQKAYLHRQVSEKKRRKRDQYTVFLIEDNIDDREQILNTLEKSPYVYNVHCFEKGADLVTYFVNEGYYSSGAARKMRLLILMDIHLPGVDGLEILRDLKAHPMTQNIPMIVITGDTSSKRVEEARQLQVSGYILKPVCLDTIHKAIHP